MKNFDLIRRAGGMYTRICEVGRKISRANAKKLQTAMQEISDLLAQIAESAVSEADRSFSDRQKLLQDTLRKKLNAGVDYPNSDAYVCDVFDAYLVYLSGDEYFRAVYTIGSDGAVTIGDPIEVLPQMTYQDAPSAMGEAADITSECVPLVEGAALSEAATAALKIISPGWGSSGYYSPAVLRSAAPLFTAGTKMFWNHQTAAEEASRPEGNLDHLAAELSEDAKWQDNGASGPGIYAKAKVFERFTGAVRDMAPHIGVSIRASGISKQGEAEGRKGPVIERIASVRSVDYVTVPGRGGEILQLFESAGRRGPEAAIPPHEEHTNMDKAEIQALIAEAVKPFQEAATANTAENSRLREALALRDARDFTARKLATILMPEATRARLTESLTLRAIVKNGQLDEAGFGALIETEAKAELAYLAGITGSGAIRGMGSAAPVQEAKPEDVAKQFASNLARLGGLTEAGAQAALAGRKF